MSKSSSSSGGIGFLGVLTIVFIVLKLLDKIDWSWLWVLSPLWLPIVVPVVALAAVGVIVGFVYLVIYAFEGKAKRSRRTVRISASFPGNGLFGKGKSVLGNFIKWGKGEKKWKS